MTGAGFSPNESLSELRTTPAITYCRSRLSSRRPSGSASGRNRRTNSSLTIACARRRRILERREVAARCAAESPSCGNSPAVTMLLSARSGAASGRARPSSVKPRSDRPWMSSGTWFAIAADSTPGSARRRVSSRPVKSRTAASLRLRPERSYSASSTPSRRKPGSVSSVSLKLRTNSAAAISTTSASATSTAINPLRIGLRPAVRAPDRSATCGSTRASCTAGAAPKISAAEQAERRARTRGRRRPRPVRILTGTERDHRHRAHRVGRPDRDRRRRARRRAAPAAGSRSAAG